MEVASLILSRSAELITLKDSDGRSVIHHAAAAGHLKLVQLLLGQGSPVNQTDDVIILCLSLYHFVPIVLFYRFH